MAQLAARGSHNPKVGGSKPPGGILIALVAQLAALRSYEPMAQGSSPCRSICFARSAARATTGSVNLIRDFYASCGWMAEWSKALVLGTSIFGCAGSNPASFTFLEFQFGEKTFFSKFPKFVKF